MNPNNYFSEQEQIDIRSAIKEAELNTSGEIRVHIEKQYDGDPSARAGDLFKSLEMDKTEERNGILFYLAFESKKFAIYTDKGINLKVPENFWNEIKEKMEGDFNYGNFTQGLITAIIIAGEQLQKHFPYKSDNTNELPDDISFGKN